MSVPTSDYSVASILGLVESDQTTPCTSDSSVPRRRRSRTIYTRGAIAKMEELFNLTQYPDIQQRESLSTEIGVPEARIQVWFQNRRSRNNKRGKPRISGRKRTRKTRNGASSNADSTCDALVERLEEEDEPATKIPKLTDTSSSSTTGQKTEIFPVFLPFYYNNYFSYPYFYNPSLGHPHYSLLKATNKFPALPTMPFNNGYFNHPLTSSSPFLPSPIPHLSPPILPGSQVSQTSGVPQGADVTTPLFSESADQMGVRQGSESSPPLFSELMNHNSAVSYRQMFVPSLRRSTRHAIADLSGADDRVDEGDDGEDDLQSSRTSSPEYSFRTESRVSLDSFGVSDSGFGHDLSSDSC